MDDCVGSLPNGTNCTVSVFFTPTASGARYGTLTINTNGYFSTTTTVSLGETGTGLTITPNPLAMGNASSGNTVTKQLWLRVAPLIRLPRSRSVKVNTTHFTL